MVENQEEVVLEKGQMSEVDLIDSMDQVTHIGIEILITEEILMDHLRE